MAELVKEKICLKKAGYLYFIKKNEKFPEYLDLYQAKAGRGKKDK